MTNLKNVSASITSRSNSFCLVWGTPDFQIPESKCASCHSSNSSGQGVHNTETPWKGKGGRCSILPGTPHPDTQEPQMLLDHSTLPQGCWETPSSLASFPVPHCWLPASHHKLKSYPFNHILIQSSSYLLIFNTCFPSKHLSRNLVNPIVAQVLCPCRDTTFLCFPVKHHHPLPFNPCVPVRWALAAGALLLWHSWSAPLILGCHYSQLNSSVISTFSNRYLVLREDLRSAI